MTALIVNILLGIILILVFVRLGSTSANLRYWKGRAELFDAANNDLLTRISKEQATSADLRERLATQGKTWAAAVRRAQNRKRS